MGATFLTDFEWAERPDGSLIGLVTPAGYSAATGVPLPFPCLAVDLNLNETCSPGAGSCPLTEIEATINDVYSDPGNGIWEQYGANGCAYDPVSNTGVLIVRHILNTSLSTPYNAGQYQAWWIMDSGVLP